MPSPSLPIIPALIARRRALTRGWGGRIAFVCGVLAAVTAHARAQPITVSAASSLRAALQSVNAEYEKLSREKISTVYGPSFRLASDIARGAVPDVFISADPASVAYLDEHKLVRGDVLMSLVRNRLVLVAREGAPQAAQSKKSFVAAMTDMASLALPDPKEHPAGKFGQAALVKLGLWDRVAAKTRSAPSTRAALDLVVNREVDGAVVYRSEALREPRTRVVQILPEQTHPPILYTVAVTTGGRGWPTVSAYVSFIRSQVALDIFERYGFERDAAWRK